MAATEKIDRGHLGRILQLTLLAPDLAEAVLGSAPMCLESPAPPELPAGGPDMGAPSRQQG